MTRRRHHAGAQLVLLTVVLMATASMVQAAEPSRVLQAVQATDDDPNPSRMYSSWECHSDLAPLGTASMA
ncbi:MAG TPA: hypothetical protein VGV93_10320 [Acidimicrobiales bacterium]|nr:hypothetical protein [Acidimicrobiales bacterium]